MADPLPAVLIPAPDMPGYDELPDGTAAARAALPPRFHIPVWQDTAEPKSWACAVCWGEGWCTSWPCEVARERGGEVFASAREVGRHQARLQAGAAAAERESIAKRADDCDAAYPVTREDTYGGEYEVGLPFGDLIREEATDA